MSKVDYIFQQNEENYCSSIITIDEQYQRYIDIKKICELKEKLVETVNDQRVINNLHNKIMNIIESSIISLSQLEIILKESHFLFKQGKEARNYYDFSIERIVCEIISKGCEV